jgi:6-phosphogluconolactonase (cycloisomerase 2 family)
VYTETNAADSNEILVYSRDHDGDLRLTDRVATRGRGTGVGLGNQGALALSADGRRLYAVNAASNDISIFELIAGRPVLIQKLPSGGEQPISITLSHDLLYVLNAGGAGNISGFYVGDNRRLYPIHGSSRPLSGSAVGPAQISFDTFGDVLVVTEKNTNKIDLYDVVDGIAQGPNVRSSAGPTPFGFAFDRRDHLIVSEAAGGAANASTVTSYEIDGGMFPLEVVSGSVSGKQTAGLLGGRIQERSLCLCNEYGQQFHHRLSHRPEWRLDAAQCERSHRLDRQRQRANRRHHQLGWPKSIRTQRQRRDDHRVRGAGRWCPARSLGG